MLLLIHTKPRGHKCMMVAKCA